MYKKKKERWGTETLGMLRTLTIKTLRMIIKSSECNEKEEKRKKKNDTETQIQILRQRKRDRVRKRKEGHNIKRTIGTK